MTAPRLLFGVGATKAGTSWLYDWLSGHPECHLRPLKEVHYFDTVETGKGAARLRELLDERAAVEARGGNRRRVEALADCIALFRTPSDAAYLDYLMRGYSGHAVVGDVTPAYGLLSVARLREMAGLGASRFVYILRDPVARLWSHVRMIAKRRDPEDAMTADRAGWILQRTIKGGEEHIAARSDYRGAIERLSAAVPSAQRLFVFFEDLFTGPAAQEICQFLGIAPHPPLEAVVHAGPALDMMPDQAQAARDFLQDQYTFVEQALGRIPEAWRHAREV